MMAINEMPLVLDFGEWVWGADPSEEISPEICLSEIPLLPMHCLSGLFVKCIGIAIILAACLNRAPVIRNIVKSKSVAGITPSSIYSDLIVYSNGSLYGILNDQPFTAFGENVALTLQCMVIILLMWEFKDDPKITLQHRLLASLVYAAYVVGISLFLPPDYYYLLMASLLPLALFAKGSQVLEANRIKHTGSNSLLTHAMNFVGSSIRILTTIKEVGWDMAMLSGFFLSVGINGIIIIQIYMYSENTKQFMLELEGKKKD